MPEAATLRLRLARLRSQRLTDDTRLGPDPAAIARAVCTVQAQSFDAATHQLRVRSAGLTMVGVQRAFADDRSIVRTWLMRGTLHLCAADDLRWLLDILGPNANRLGERRRVEVGLDEATCRRGVGVLRKALANGPMARRQIRERLVAADVLREPVGQSLIHLLFHAATLGVICSGPRVSRDDSFVLLDDWVPESERPHGETAMAELARRYLAAYGPATAADFAAWSGLPVATTRVGWAAIAGEIVPFPGAVPGLWTLALATSDAPSQRPVVRLLGYFDTMLLGYKRRDLLGGAAAETWIHTGGGGWIRPVVLVDGWITGGWRLDRVPGGFKIVVTPFERHSGRVRAGIDREVRSISEFLGRPVRWSADPAL